MLPRNQSAAFFAATPFRTAPQRPPKKIVPSKMPATSASARIKKLFIAILRFVAHGFFFLGDPMPRVQAANRQPDYKQRQRPRMFARMMIVQPDAERRAEQRRHDHRPADQSHHAQPEP